jgi:hypothetical protein
MLYVVVTRVHCTFTFEGFHRWADAPERFAYLRNLHRHVFHVKVSCVVHHADRDIEFINFKMILQDQVRSRVEDQTRSEVSGWSCEQWCSYIMSLDSRITSVEVYEDGENGASLSLERE